MSRRRKKHDLTTPAADVGCEDGSDPREFHAKPWDAPKQATRKGRQLCAQAKDALHSALDGCADTALHGLSVVSVEPAPHTGRLRVLVTAGELFLVEPCSTEPSSDRVAHFLSSTARRNSVEAALARAAGFLRSAVAAAVCRRHAPELVVELV